MIFSKVTHLNMSSKTMVGVNIIRHEELEEISSEPIGNDVYGNCFLRTFKRLQIPVVEKQLIDSTVDLLYKEAIFMQQLSTDVSLCF